MLSSTHFCDNCGAANRPHAIFCVACGKRQTLAGGQASTSLTGLLVAHHLLKQRYHIISQLGQGGFGAVYKAEDTLFGNALRAVKEMSQSGLSTQELNEAIDAFKREAFLLAGLMHPNLPRIYDHFHDGGRWYLVMDYIEGETLETRLNTVSGGKLPIEEVLNIGIQLSTVLNYLHTHQPPIIFRDLKPTNVMLSVDGHLYLIDFGIARLFKPGKAKDTLILGSPGYAASEQYGKAQTTASADIYSLGVTLHQLVSGNDPSQDPFQFAPLRLGSQPGLASLETLIMQMVEMNKDKRPSSMAAVKQELQRIATQQMTAPPFGIATGGAIPFPKSKEQWLDEGWVLFGLKRYGEALVAFDQAIHLDPTLALAYLNRGRALHGLNRYQEALVAFDQAIHLDSTLALAYVRKGSVLFELKRYQEALAVLDQAIRLDPNNADAYNAKGLVLHGLKRYGEALAAFDQAIRLDDNYASAYTNKGLVLFDLERYGEALAVLDQAIRLDPNFANAYNIRGSVLNHLKRPWEALAAYDQAIRLSDNFAFAYNNKGNVLNDLERYGEALAAYDQAIRLDPNYAAPYFNKGRVLDNLKQPWEALAAYDQAIRLDPNYTFAYFNKGRVLDNLKQPWEALAAYDQAIRLDPNYADAYNNKGNVLNGLNRYQEALAVLDQTIRLDPNMADAYLNKGNSFYYLKRPWEALAAYDQAIRLDPNMAVAYNNKGNVLNDLKRYSEAKAAHAQASRLGYSR